jgi:hypothetical protein
LIVADQQRPGALLSSDDCGSSVERTAKLGIQAVRLSVPGARLAGMSDDVRLRNVEEPDLEVFFEQQLDPEAARLANFPSRDRERFMATGRPRS